MRCLNRQRATILFNHLLHHGTVLTPQEVAKRERIFGRGSIIPGPNSPFQGTCKFGASLRDLLDSIAVQRTQARLSHTIPFSLAGMVNLYEDERYILWCINAVHPHAMIVLKKDADAETCLRAWMHALLSVQLLSYAEKAEPALSTTGDHRLLLLDEAKSSANSYFNRHKQIMEERGWDLSISALETHPATRISIPAVAEGRGTRHA